MKKLVILVFTIVLLGNCATTTNILTKPDDAKVYVNNKFIGNSPVKYTSRKVSFSSTTIEIEKEGYKKYYGILKRNEVFKPTRLLSGLFLWYPNIFYVMDYDLYHNYDLEILDKELYINPVISNSVTQANPISVGKSDVDMEIPSNNKKNPHRYALIIGNEDYSSFQTGLSSEVNVDYAINDAKVFSEYCEKTLGVDSRNLKLLPNATFRQMTQSIAWVQNLSDVEGGKAEIIFYYSGHGLPDETTKEGYLMPVDVSGNNVSDGISLNYLYQELNKYPAKEITVVLDACFSGGARNEGLVAMKGVKIKPKEDVVSGNMVVFASSSGNESSAVYREKQHGYLTYFLLKKIQETNGYVNYKDLSDYLDYQVRKETALIGKVQTPKVNVSPSARDQWKYWTFR